MKNGRDISQGSEPLPPSLSSSHPSSILKAALIEERTRLMIWGGGVVRVIQSGCGERGDEEGKKTEAACASDGATNLPRSKAQTSNAGSLPPSPAESRSAAASIDLAAAAHWRIELCAAEGSFKVLILTASNRQV